METQSEWDKERTFEIDQVSPVYLLTALLVVPFGIYYLLNFLSPLIHRITAMKISEIYIYPIKSLRAVKVNEAIGTKYGFKHDRTFMLFKKQDGGTYKNMAVSKAPEMTQFLQEIDGYDTTDGIIRVTYRAFGDTSKEKSITIPLIPDTSKLEPFNYDLHSSPVSGFKMPPKYSEWFTSCFDYEVLLVYLGSNTRPVLFQDMQPLEPDPLTRLLRRVPLLSSYVDNLTGLRQQEQWKIGFADCAPYLICSQTSLDDVSSRLPDGTEMDITKFRPNIVIKGAFEAYQEDYWGKIKINNKTEIIMAHNCVRCQSVNIDYETGTFGKGPSGQVLKKMQHDRRIDIGAKWSPVFGRYSFWDLKGKDEVVRVGDRVNVSKVNEGLTVWSWPGLA